MTKSNNKNFKLSNDNFDNSECFISVVVPLHNFAHQLPGFLYHLHHNLKKKYQYFEVIFIDDSSVDGTPDLIEKLLHQYEACHYYSFSRPLGLETTISVGISKAIGDICVTMIPGNDPIDKISEMIQLVRSHRQLIVGQAQNIKYNPIYVILRKVFFYLAHRIFDVNLIPDATHFMAMDRQTLNSINIIKNKFRYIKIFSALPGYSVKLYPYVTLTRQPYIHRSPWQLIRLGIDVITSSSIRPLKLVSLLCVFSAFMNLIYLVPLSFELMFSPQSPQINSLISFQVSALFFIISLAVITANEYLGRLIIENRNRPFYFIKKQYASEQSIPNQNSLKNVVDQPELPEFNSNHTQTFL